jgi:hypothetical protein
VYGSITGMKGFLSVQSYTYAATSIAPSAVG